MSDFYLCCNCHMTAMKLENQCSSCIDLCKEMYKSSKVLTIVAAAVKRDGVVFTGVRHGHVIKSMVEVGFLTDMKDPIREEEQGFIASDGKYYSRQEAREIAINAAQVNPDHGTLYSEDLW